MKKTILVLTMIVLFSGMVMANGSADAGSTEPETVELSIMWWGSQNRHDRTIQTIELYMQENPHVDFTYEFAGWADYWTKVTTMAAGGNLPDIMQHNYPLLGTWKEKGLLNSWQPYVDDGTLDFSDVETSTLQGGVLDGELYGVNLGTNSQCIVLDVEAFRDAGVALPDQNWTWDEFDAICREINAASGIYGIGSGLWKDQIWGSLMISNGETQFASDGTALGYTDDSVLVDHFRMILGQIEDGVYPTRDIEISQYANNDNVEQNALVNGEAAMAYLWSNQISALMAAAGQDREFVLIHLPRLTSDGLSSNYIKPSQFFALTAHTDAPAEAASFADFVTNDIGANEILFAERGIPIAGRVREALKPQLDPAAILAFAFIDEVAKDASPIPAPDPGSAKEIVNNIYTPQVVDPVAFGEISPQEGVALLRVEANRILGDQ